MKTCSACGQTKELSDFYVMRKAKDGHRPDCKPCFTAMKSRSIARMRAIPKPETVDDLLKTCSQCGEQKPLTAYFRHKDTRDGLRPDCKDCLTRKQKARYESDKPKILERQRTYVEKNADAVKAAHKRAHQRRMQNPEYVAAKRAYTLEYDRKNVMEKIRRNQEAMKRRYSAAICDLTEEQWVQIKRSYGFRCAYCGIEPATLTMDHVIPPLHGGNHTAINVVPACYSCNARKGSGPPPPFHVIPTAFVS